MAEHSRVIFCDSLVLGLLIFCGSIMLTLCPETIFSCSVLRSWRSGFSSSAASTQPSHTEVFQKMHKRKDSRGLETDWESNLGYSGLFWPCNRLTLMDTRQQWAKKHGGDLTEKRAILKTEARQSRQPFDIWNNTCGKWCGGNISMGHGMSRIYCRIKRDKEKQVSFLAGVKGKKYTEIQGRSQESNPSAPAKTTTERTTSKVHISLGFE